MRILFFVQHLGAGGVVRQIATQAPHLNRRGHTLSVLGLYERDEGWKQLWDASDGPFQAVLGRPPTRALRAAFPLLGAIRRLRRALRQERVDVLYAYEGNLARFIAWVATRRSGTTLVWGVQGAGGRHSLRKNWKRALPLHLCRAVSASVPLLIANSDGAAAARRAEGFRCRRQLTIPNGFDADTFSPDPDARARVRADWGIAGEPLIGLVGRLDPFKGQRTFLEAAAILARRRPEIRFVLVGDGLLEHRSELELLSRELDLTERLLWAGLRADMPAVYNALDILCSASEREGFPNVIGEAMACGVPCVVTDVGESAVVVADSGIVVSPHDPEQLADALETMLGMLADLRPLEIRRLLTSRFPLERCVDAIEEALAKARAEA